MKTEEEINSEFSRASEDGKKFWNNFDLEQFYKDTDKVGEIMEYDSEIPAEAPAIVEIEGIKFAVPEPVMYLLKAVSEERDELQIALTLIGDIGYDYDGYGKADSLKKLIDEMVGYARNPQSAVDVLTAEESE